MTEKGRETFDFPEKENNRTQESAADTSSTGEFLRWMYNHPNTDLAAELELHKFNFLAPLEETGIVPKLSDPNPFDPDKQADEYEQWWQEHPGDLQAFEEAFIRREQALRDLWLGVVLYRMTGGKLFEGLIGSRQIANRLP